MGIGEAIAKLFVQRGAQVVLLSRDSGRLEAARARIGHLEQTLALACDVRNREEIDRAIGLVVHHFQRIDIWVNNAGHGLLESIANVSISDCRETFETNFFGALEGMKAVIPIMKQQGSGTIINISSVHEDLPFPGYSAYCAAKGGLRMLCRHLALELAPHGINIVNVAPGAIDTPINERTMSDPEKKLALKREIPLGRVGEPQEVAKLVCYLASDDAAYITGTTVVIDGGLMHQTGSL